MSDLRRSGAVEADAGGATGTDLAAKMANTIDANSRLQRVYKPVNLASVRRLDNARKIGRLALQKEQKPTKSVTPIHDQVSQDHRDVG